MAKYSHSLSVKFDSEDDELIYSGVSFYNKNIVDDIEIRKNAIIINFVRSSKMKTEMVLDSPKSNIRYHLQRTLCFYLAVIGNIPDVDSITFTCSGETVDIPHESFTGHWKNCDIDICLPVESAKVVFESENCKYFYIMISHFLKSQLDHFSHDRFRSAWSTLNAVYTYMDSINNEDTYRSENNKLSTLMYIIDKNTMNYSVDRIKRLKNDDFWEHISWYNAFHDFSEKDFKSLISGSLYNDSELLGYICNHMRVFSEEIINDEESWAILKEKSTKKNNRPKDRLKFIVCRYCYMMRNKSFHAETIYPLFVISDDAETRIEKILTEVLLLTIKDLFILYSDKLNN